MLRFYICITEDDQHSFTINIQLLTFGIYAKEEGVYLILDWVSMIQTLKKEFWFGSHSLSYPWECPWVHSLVGAGVIALG